LNLAEYPFLADENVHPGVIAHLRDSGFDLLSVVETGLIGSSDEKVLQFAFEAGRIVLTHDSGLWYVGPGLSTTNYWHFIHSSRAYPTIFHN
jgi:hypothetical protein